MEIQLQSKIQQLVIDYPETGFSAIRTFAAKPTPGIEKRYGRLFGLIEIKSNQPGIKEFIDFLVDEIKTQYYQLSELPTTDDSLENRFEAALNKVNIAIAAFIETEELSLNLNKINILVGLIAGRDLIFSASGNINIFLLQNLKKTDYNMVDLLEFTRTVLTKPSPLKFFSQVVSGHIKASDLVLAATNNIFDYFSLDRVKTTIGQAVDRSIELKKLLASLGPRENFGMLLLETEKIIQPQVTEQVALETAATTSIFKDSMSSLIKTEQSTQKVLTPSLTPELKKYFFQVSGWLNNWLKAAKNLLFTAAGKIHRQSKNITPVYSDRTSVKINQQLNQGWHNFQQATKPVKAGAQKTLLFVQQSRVGQTIGSWLNKQLRAVINFYYTLPRHSRRWFLASITLGLILIIGITWASIRNNSAKNLASFNQTLTAIENKKNEAEGSLIYRDENKARQLLIEAKNSLADLQSNNAGQRQKITDLQQAVEAQLLTLRHLAIVGDITQVINFANLDNQADMADWLIAFQQTIFAQNLNNQAFYKANLSNRSLIGLATGSLNTGKISWGLAVNNIQLLLINGDNHGFFLNNQTATITPATLNIDSSHKITSLAAFNNRLYLLDSTNNQIYRVTQNNNGFSALSAWIDDNSQINLKTAIDLTIDGSVYVLNKTGAVSQYNQGKITDFKSASLDPATAGATKIKTTFDSKFIYVLDPEQKRIIVYNKQGQLINQYQSDTFTDLKDFVVVEKEKRIYVLNGNTILGFGLQHLN